MFLNLYVITLVSTFADGPEKVSKGHISALEMFQNNTIVAFLGSLHHHLWLRPILVLFWMYNSIFYITWFVKESSFEIQYKKREYGPCCQFFYPILKWCIQLRRRVVLFVCHYFGEYNCWRTRKSFQRTRVSDFESINIYRIEIQ